MDCLNIPFVIYVAISYKQKKKKRKRAKVEQRERAKFLFLKINSQVCFLPNVNQIGEFFIIGITPNEDLVIKRFLNVYELQSLNEELCFL